MNFDTLMAQASAGNINGPSAAVLIVLILASTAVAIAIIRRIL